MRIGGVARYFAEPSTKDDLEAAWAFAQEKDVPLIVLGSGSNTVFADGVIDALVLRVKHASVAVKDDMVTVGAGANLAMLINDLAKHGLDLSPLTGIPGTLGGAIFGNAGQGPSGVWIDRFVESVTAFHEGQWVEMPREACDFGYRESVFKHGPDHSPVIWEAVLRAPRAEPMDIESAVQTLLQRRIETQPHRQTAGSCFKAVDAVPAWKLIDAAGLRGFAEGGVQVSEKHANFLLNTGDATYEDAVRLVERVRQSVSAPLDVEMRFVEPDGALRF